MKRLSIAFVALLVTTSLAPLAAASQQADGSAYAGAHVSFESEERAVTDYAVDGETLLGTVKVQSADSAEGSSLVDVGADLEAVTAIEGSNLALQAESETSATVSTKGSSDGAADGSAALVAHDNENGILVVESGGQSQYVQANLSAGSQAESEGEKRVAVTTANGTEGTFVVVGDGEVTVNDEGNVTAKLGEDARLAFRAYPDGKSEDDETEEQLIADGKAAAEVHVMERDGEVVTDAVEYGHNTTVEAESEAENQVALTVDRASHEGTVLITTVSESAVGSIEDLEVTVDGEAAVEASSQSELEGAIGGEESRYLVRQQGDAEASSDVLVAVNHFSTRTVEIGSASDGSTTDATTTDAGGDENDPEDTVPSDGQPGFGIVAALVALGGALLAARLH